MKFRDGAPRADLERIGAEMLVPEPRLTARVAALEAHEHRLNTLEARLAALEVR